jgi:hypothetical protein
MSIKKPHHKPPTYEHWGRADGREGIQRTLMATNEADAEFLRDGVRIVDEDGNERSLTVAEANERGFRRIVAAKDIITGEMRWRE